MVCNRKEAVVIYQSIIKFNLYLKGAQCILCCNHKPLEPFLSCCRYIPKCNCWSMELSDYNLTFIYIKGSKNILSDAISRLKTLDIYKEPLDNPNTSDTITCIAEMVNNDLHSHITNKRIPSNQL